MGEERKNGGPRARREQEKQPWARDTVPRPSCRLTRPLGSPSRHVSLPLGVPPTGFGLGN